MKREIFEIIDKFVYDGEKLNDPKYSTRWKDDQFCWTEGKWENSCSWNGDEGLLSYKGKDVHIIDFRFTTEPVIVSDCATFMGDGAECNITLE